MVPGLETEPRAEVDLAARATEARLSAPLDLGRGLRGLGFEWAVALLAVRKAERTSAVAPSRPEFDFITMQKLAPLGES